MILDYQNISTKWEITGPFTLKKCNLDKVIYISKKNYLKQDLFFMFIIVLLTMVIIINKCTLNYLLTFNAFAPPSGWSSISISKEPLGLPAKSVSGETFTTAV
jgi:hypothetical protein